MERKTIQNLWHRLVGRPHRSRLFRVAWFPSVVILIAVFAGFRSGIVDAGQKADIPRARGPIPADVKADREKSINDEKPLHHYVFFGMDREKLKDAKSFLETSAFEGAQVAYSWRQLEHDRDDYEFSMIREDLAFLEARGKKLWIQIQDVMFSPQWKPVPEYLLKDSKYHGGIDPQYQYEPGNEAHAVAVGGGTALGPGRAGAISEIAPSYALFRSDGLPAFAVVSSRENDELTRTSHSLAVQVADGVRLWLRDVNLAERLDTHDPRLALLVTYHEFMWELLDALGAAGAVTKPTILRSTPRAELIAPLIVIVRE